MNAAIYKPLSVVSGKINLPGSKSISNRVLMIKALSGLQFEVDNISDSDDTQHLQKALSFVRENKSGTIDIGHAGTDMRFLTAFLASQKGNYELTGSKRMQQRPIKELVEVLTQLGANISYKKEKGYPPLTIHGNVIEGGKASISGSISSQFISALLLTAPYFTNGLELEITGNIVSIPYINMTVELMKLFGADVNWNANRIIVKPVPYTYTQNRFAVESDWSAASYYYSVVALSGEKTTLALSNLFQNSLQADAVCAELYKNFGMQTEYSGNEITITKVQAPGNTCFEYDFVNCPDIAQTLACTSIGLNRSFHLKGLQTLRLKETDRILALQTEFAKLDIVTQVTESSIEYKTTHDLFPESKAAISTYNDHRMAMSFAPLCLITEELAIENPEVVSKSYPKFWDDLKTIGFAIKEN